VLHIILASTRKDDWESFVGVLGTQPELRLEQVDSGAEALSAVRTHTPHLVILDTDLPDGDPLDLVPELLRINAMVNTAVVSPLSEAEFHEASEGLGILACLPVQPSGSEATELLRQLRSILGLSA
jgi:DNA-binding response OmpR family regulator